MAKMVPTAAALAECPDGYDASKPPAQKSENVSKKPDLRKIVKSSGKKVEALRRSVKSKDKQVESAKIRIKKISERMTKKPKSKKNVLLKK